MKVYKVEVDAVNSAERGAKRAAAAAAEGLVAKAEGAMKLTFFHNSNDVPVADLYMGERRLIATTHPATIVGAMFLMKRTMLEVATSVGSHTGTLEFLEPNQEGLPLTALKALMGVQPHHCQFLHLAPNETYVPLLQGFDLFAGENWYEPNDVSDEYIRAAHHHLPKDVIKRPLLKPAPKGWKKTLKRRNGWIYFPDC